MTDPYVSQPASSPTDPSVTTANERATGVSMPESGSSADVVKRQSRMVADDAAEGGKRVARVAADEAATVADEAKNQARSLWEQASSQLSNQAADQKSTLASWLRGLAEELKSMADAPQRDLAAYGSPSAGTPGFATGLADRGANYARSAASWLDDREPSAILDEVSSFARRRPGTFLVIAATAGVVAGRLTRGLTAGEDGHEGRREGGGDRYAGERLHRAASDALIGGACLSQRFLRIEGNESVERAVIAFRAIEKQLCELHARNLFAYERARELPETRVDHAAGAVLTRSPWGPGTTPRR